MPREIIVGDKVSYRDIFRGIKKEGFVNSIVQIIGHRRHDYIGKKIYYVSNEPTEIPDDVYEDYIELLEGERMEHE